MINWIVDSGKIKKRYNLPDVSKKSIGLLVLLLTLFLISCCAFLHEKYNAEVTSAGQCLPVFPDKDGWYGGDGAYSIKLDRERTLWLFGDTFVDSNEGKNNRVDMDFIAGTTLAISTCSDSNEFGIKYYLKKENGKFTSSFGENEWLWPQDPFIVKNVLYIPLIVVTATNREGEIFNFRITGHRFARIKDFSAADPYKWGYDYIDLTPAIPVDIRAFATTSVVYKDHVYFYPFYVYSRDKINVFGNILARIPADKIDNPAGAVEYFTKEGTWQNKLNPETVKVVLDAGVSELSVRYHADDKKWMAVYLTTQNKGDKVLYQDAENPEGPWSEQKTLGIFIPEVDFQSHLYDKNNFCYAGKEHIEFSRNRNLVVTYVCNSLEDPNVKTSFIRHNLFLYRPVVKEIAY